MEGFGRVPVSVAFSPTTTHMFIGFKAGGVRIYPEGGDTLVAAIYDDCVDMEDEVRQALFLALGLFVRVLKILHRIGSNESEKSQTHRIGEKKTYCCIYVLNRIKR